MHGLDDGLVLVAAADVGLVGGDDEHVAGVVQGAASFGHAGEEFELGKGGRRVGLTGAHDLAVERAVAVEEDGGAHLEFLILGFPRITSRPGGRLID